ncbi:hypothetical protein EJ08DRAFT_699010 [Tothia fuscella]|uniref:Uncharacterized protein n=1 Tax=Tothia fuscella TaxID=1048955 RepID=A0A9P4NNM6_9PEZI|nr:hypothetical protein EJ08DRAFT_699010 [Tothia fuscella]
MSFSDQQLVTGIAVLVAGIKKLADGNITIYHFSLVTDLAWFSSNTHLLSLLTIRDFSESVKPSKSPTLSHTQVRINFPGPRILRAFLMVLLAALLLYCSYVTGYEDWYESFRCPARCTLAGSKGGKPLDWTIMNFTLILYAYPIAMIQLFPWSRRFWIENLRHKLIDDKGLLPPEPPSPISLPHNHAKPPTNLTKATAATPSTPGATPPGPLTVIWKAWWSVFLLIWYTMSSEVLTFVVQIVWFSLGVKWTLEDRVNGHSAMEQEEIDAENEWGFAQLVPILLLLLPFLQLVQSYSAQKEKLRKKRAKTQTQDQNLPMALLTPLTTP